MGGPDGMMTSGSGLGAWLRRPCSLDERESTMWPQGAVGMAHRATRCGHGYPAIVALRASWPPLPPSHSKLGGQWLMS